VAFARSSDHLDGDQQSIARIVVPRPNSSVLYRVRDQRLADAGIFAGDLAVIDRDQPLRGNAIALVSVDGVPRLVRIRRDGGRFSFDDLPTDDVPIEYLGLGSRLIRFLLPEKAVTGPQRL
jgi:SOS-response transcriptional repressor LexA